MQKVLVTGGTGFVASHCMLQLLQQGYAVKTTIRTSDKKDKVHKDLVTLITEHDYTDPHEKGLSAYNKSKVMSERAAWQFIREEGNGLEFCTVNPMGIFGPSLGPDLSSGFELLRNIMNGGMKAIPNMDLGIVDVMDVDTTHTQL